jgi:ribosome-associated translation inhibitor RaiA
MPYSDQSYNLRIELDEKGCELSAEQIEKMEATLTTLRKLTEAFPVSTLYVDVVYHHTPQDYHVKTSLVLPGKTLFTGERDRHVQPAFERCVSKLIHKITAYKSQMSRDEEHAKHAAGTYQSVEPNSVFDPEAIENAVKEADYIEFRHLLYPFEESLRKRIGRWIQRKPIVESRLLDEIQISDIVEEVFLMAFERFPNRLRNVPPGDWLEQLIDPSVQAILQSPDEEYANISFVQTLLGETDNREKS